MEGTSFHTRTIRVRVCGGGDFFLALGASFLGYILICRIFQSLIIKYYVFRQDLIDHHQNMADQWSEEKAALTSELETQAETIDGLMRKLNSSTDELT